MLYDRQGRLLRVRNEAVVAQGGAETMYPEYQKKLQELMKAMPAPKPAAKPAATTSSR